MLDIGLPNVDGLRILGHWRRTGQTMPVLVLTSRRTWSEKVAGFDAGCDDYLTKPFHIEEMLARVRGLIRRAAGHAKPVLECGPMRFDTRTSRVSTAGEPVDLTANELKVFSYLIHHQDQVVSRSELIEHIYDRDFDRDSNTIEVFIARLRKKIGADLIQTRKGLGYCLTVSEIVA